MSPSNWRILIKAHFDMQTLMKLSLNFTSVKFKQKITTLKTVKKKKTTVIEYLMNTHGIIQMLKLVIKQFKLFI